MMAVKFTALLSKHMLSMLNHKQLYVLGLYSQFEREGKGMVTVGSLRESLAAMADSSATMADYEHLIIAVFRR